MKTSVKPADIAELDGARRLGCNHGSSQTLDGKANRGDRGGRLERRDIVLRGEVERGGLPRSGIGGERRRRIDDADIVLVDHVERLEIVPSHLALRRLVGLEGEVARMRLDASDRDSVPAGSDEDEFLFMTLDRLGDVSVGRELVRLEGPRRRLSGFVPALLPRHQIDGSAAPCSRRLGSPPWQACSLWHRRP